MNKILNGEGRTLARSLRLEGHNWKVIAEKLTELGWLNLHGRKLKGPALNNIIIRGWNGKSFRRNKTKAHYSRNAKVQARLNKTANDLPTQPDLGERLTSHIQVEKIIVPTPETDHWMSKYVYLLVGMLIATGAVGAMAYTGFLK